MSALRNDVVPLNRTFNYVPQSLSDLKDISETIATSNICPTALRNKPSDVLMILLTGSELGLKVSQSLRVLGSFNGIPFAYGDGLTALIQRHPEYEWMKESYTGNFEGGTLTAHCTIKRKDQEPVTCSYSLEEAKKAGLLSKAGPWVMHPKRMLARRARSYAGKDTFADALMGLITEDEATEINIPIENKTITIEPSKGVAGLRQNLGIPSNEAEIVIEPESSAVSDPYKEMDSLIIEKKVTDKAIQLWLKKAKVESLHDLPLENVEKIIAHLKEKSNG